MPETSATHEYRKSELFTNLVEGILRLNGPLDGLMWLIYNPYAGPLCGSTAIAARSTYCCRCIRNVSTPDPVREVKLRICIKCTVHPGLFALLARLYLRKKLDKLTRSPNPFGRGGASQLELQAEQQKQKQTLALAFAFDLRFYVRNEQ